MDRRSSSLLMAFLFLFGNLAAPLVELNRSDSTENQPVGKTLFNDAFVGFTSEN